MISKKFIYSCVFRLLICSLFFVTIGVIKADPIRTLSLQFERKVTEKNVEEITRGVIFFKAPSDVVIEVLDTVSQMMIFKGKVLEIYYPESKEAFRIRSKTPIPLPFVDAILNSIGADRKMLELGYSLQKHELKDGTLYTHWSPPSKLKKVIGKTILGSVDDRMVSIEIYTPKNRLSAKSLYRKHLFLGDRPIPMEISSKIYFPSGDWQSERIIYSEPKLNLELPDRIRNFKIPKSAKVKEIEF